MYFSIGAATLLLSNFMVFGLPKSEFFKHNSKGHIDFTSNTNLQDTDSSTGTNLRANMLENQERDRDFFPHLVQVHKNIIIPGYGLVVLYIQTFLVFPAVMLQGEIGFITNISWEVWFVITVFNFTDTLSRFISEKLPILNSKFLAIATL